MKREGRSIRRISFLAFAAIAIMIFGGCENRSDKKVGSVEDTSPGKSLSFEEVHKFAPADIEGSALKGETDNKDKLAEHFNAGIRFALRKDYDKAIEEYKKALEYEPDKGEIYNNLGFAYFDKGDIEGSIVEHKKALELAPNLANAYYGLALAFEQAGDTAGAIENWEKYLDVATPGTIWWNKAKERLDKIKNVE